MTDYMHDRALECLGAIDCINKNAGEQMSYAICRLGMAAIEYELLFRNNCEMRNMLDVECEPYIEELFQTDPDQSWQLAFTYYALKDISYLRAHREIERLPKMIHIVEDWIEETGE